MTDLHHKLKRAQTQKTNQIHRPIYPLPAWSQTRPQATEHHCEEFRAFVLNINNNVPE